MPPDAVPGTSGRPATSASHAAAPATAAPAPSVVVERPPPGLLRGKAPLPAPLLGAIGGVALVILVGFYFRKLASRRSP
jgi:Tfp pilus assembly protein FimV